MTSIVYRSPRLYRAMIWAVHRGFGRYREIALRIGHGKRVLDVGCGSGLLERYLCSCNAYVGWDLNERFLRDMRSRNLHAVQVDVAAVDAFPSEYDVIVAVDIEHHIWPKKLPDDPRILRLEPSKPWPRVPKVLLRAWDRVVGCDDGINGFEDRLGWRPNGAAIESGRIDLPELKMSSDSTRHTHGR